MYKRLFIILFGVSTIVAASVDCIVYSFDRPMQLAAFLESYAYYCSPRGRVEVIYRSSSPEFDKGYEVLQGDFPGVIFTKQGKNPVADFKPLTMAALANSPSAYLVFAVDDIIITDFINFDECIRSLEQSGAYAFYLRLGLNLDYCYTMNRPQPLPQYQINGDCIVWKLQGSAYDWGYPNTLDMAMYRKRDIVPVVAGISFKSPNTFEGTWSAYPPLRPTGIAFLHSKMINIPVNLVQSDCLNRNMQQHSPKELLDYYREGKKIDIHRYFRYQSRSAHVEAPLYFIARN